jgi:DNA-binding NtrC family response regulator
LKEKILVVDDDTSILRSISIVLERNGYEVETVETAEEALDRIRSTRYDLALVDIWLPDMKGTELLAKAKKEFEHTVKIIITGYPSVEAGAKARDLGADAFIIKPVNMPDLLSIIHMFLEEENPYLTPEEKGLTLADINSDVTE